MRGINARCSTIFQCHQTIADASDRLDPEGSRLPAEPSRLGDAAIDCIFADGPAIPA